MQGWLDDLYKGTVTANEDGEYGGKGFGAFILKPFVDEGAIESGKQQGAVKRTITAAGENPADYNLGSGATVYDAQGAIATARRQRADNKEQTAHTRAIETTMAPITAQLTSQTNQFNQTMQRQMAQDAKTHQLQLMQMADTKEARADEMEFRRMESRKEDRRYNERMEQLDRKDRRTAMSSIAAGLASLGAAFAM